MQTVHHPHFGAGELLKTYMGGYEWEVLFASGRRFRLPAKEFTAESYRAVALPPVALAEPKARISLDTDQFRARQTLEALRVGIVPVQDAETLTIGLEAERVTLDRALDRSRERGGDVLAVIGDYGFGKSHFVELAAACAARELCRGRRQPGSGRGAAGQGAQDLRGAGQCAALPGHQPPRPAAAARKRRWPARRDRRVRASLPARGERCPLAAALLALAECPSQTALEATVEWLSGQSKPRAEMKSCFKRPPRLYITGENARQYSYLLTGLSLLATLVGYSGMAVLIDESEHYSLLRATQRERADSFFQAMIVSALGLNNGRIDARTIPDHNRVEYPLSYTSEPHLFFLFALTESADRMPVGTWLAPSHLVRLDDRFIEKDIREFYNTLLRYHALAYDYTLAPARYADAANIAPGLLARALAQHRINLREVIRAAVTTCDLLYLYPDYAADEMIGELKAGLKV
ncbi:MAG: DUF2791 family P-loop domain-containing protein [Anaerolineales bacterium]|nr:DUF2791 family P-loop domain-containing protein [Anaerolineales bacterium]